MPVIGLNFTKVEAEKSKMQPKGELKVNSVPKVLEVKEASIHSVDKKALSMEFEFLTTYSPEIGHIKITGNLIFLSEESDSIMDEWTKTKDLPKNVSTQVINHLFRKCLIKMAVLAEDVQLPPPVQIPMVKPKE